MWLLSVSFRFTRSSKNASAQLIFVSEIINSAWKRMSAARVAQTHWQGFLEAELIQGQCTLDCMRSDSIFILWPPNAHAEASVRRERREKSKQVYDFTGALLSSGKWRNRIQNYLPLSRFLFLEVVLLIKLNFDIFYSKTTIREGRRKHASYYQLSDKIHSASFYLQLND